MFNFTCQYDSAQHYLIEPECLEWCRRQVANPEDADHLFAYFHLREGTYVIAWWIGEPRSQFVDMLNLGFSLANFDRSAAQRFAQQLRKPTTAKDILHSTRETNSTKIHQLQDTGLAEAEELKQDYGLN